MTDIKIVEPTIFDLSSPGRTGVTMPASDVPETALPPVTLLRSDRRGGREQALRAGAGGDHTVAGARAWRHAGLGVDLGR